MAWDTVIFVFVVDEIPMLLHTLVDFHMRILVTIHAHGTLFENKMLIFKRA